jgi:hypothetical protein
MHLRVAVKTTFRIGEVFTAFGIGNVYLFNLYKACIPVVTRKESSMAAKDMPRA